MRGYIPNLKKDLPADFLPIIEMLDGCKSAGFALDGSGSSGGSSGGIGGSGTTASAGASTTAASKNAGVKIKEHGAFSSLIITAGIWFLL